MKIGNLNVGDGGPCVIIAEIGISHNGSLEIAKNMIDAAVDAGCSMVKFQKRSINLCYSEEELARPRESPLGTTNGDLKRGLEFGFDEYCQIDEYCRKKNILWFASPWDTESVKFLEQFDLPCYKVASACLTDPELLHAISATKKPVIMSTGMSTVGQIHAAIENLWPVRDMALLACTGSYPAAIVDLNLERIHTLQLLFKGIPIGYSGHEVGVWSTLCAVAMGAVIVERHLTLDRSSWGSDQAASLEPHGFAMLCREIRDFEKARGSGELRLLECEIEVMKKLRRVK